MNSEVMRTLLSQLPCSPAHTPASPSLFSSLAYRGQIPLSLRLFSPGHSHRTSHTPCLEVPFYFSKLNFPGWPKTRQTYPFLPRVITTRLLPAPPRDSGPLTAPLLGSDTWISGPLPNLGEILSLVKSCRGELSLWLGGWG